MCVELRAKKLWNVYTLTYTEGYANSSFSHVENTPQPCRQSTKLRTMIVNIKTKMVVKFEASEMMSVELRAKKLCNVYTLLYTEGYVNPSFSHVENTPQPCRQFMKLRTMIVNIKTKMVVKFEASEMMSVELRAKKLWNVYTLPYTEGYVNPSFSHVENTPQPCRQSTKLS